MKPRAVLIIAFLALCVVGITLYVTQGSKKTTKTTTAVAAVPGHGCAKFYADTNWTMGGHRNMGVDEYHMDTFGNCKFIRQVDEVTYHTDPIVRARWFQHTAAKNGLVSCDG